MKKIIALLTVAVLALSMAACGSSNDSASDNNASANSASAEQEAAGGTLTMATNATFPPYEYYDGDEIVGIDAEIAQAIADKLGMKLEIQDMDFNSIIIAVQGGKADMGLAGMTVTPDREKNVNFSQSYATGVQVVIVPEDSDIQTIDDLEGKMIGVQESTTGHIYCAASPEEGGYGEDHVTAYNSGANAVEALKTGKVDCVVIDNEPAKAFVEANEGLKILDTEFAVEDYAVAISKDNEELLEKVNGALDELKADGTLQSIIDKYIKAE